MKVCSTITHMKRVEDVEVNDYFICHTQEGVEHLLPVSQLQLREIK